MTTLYLTGIELVNFRTFAKLDIALAPAPGILVVHGSNGLGKSSLFDALEWTLTGDIDHFRSIDGYKKFGQYLCRKSAKKLGPTSSALRFSDGTRIERQLTSYRATKSTLHSSIDDVSEFLRVPDWTQRISALNRYLLLTHFLSQSTLSRLTHRKAGDRFEILKEASQSAALQKFGIALHGSGTTQPAKAFVKRIADLGRDADELKVLLEQEAETWSTAAASGVLDDASAATLASEISDGLKAAWQLLAIGQAPSSWTSLAESSALQGAIDEVNHQARLCEFAITEARRLLALNKQYDSDLVQAGAAAAEADRALAEAMQAVSDARGVVALCQTELEAAVAALTATKDAHRNYLSLRLASEALGRASAELAESHAASADASAALAEAEREVERSVRLSQIEARLRLETDQLEKRLSALVETRDIAMQWLEQADAITSMSADLHELEEITPTAEEDADKAALQVEEAKTAAAERKRLLDILQSSVSVMSAAVSSVAAHLTPEAHECPVCATEFGSSDELHVRANAAAERLAPLVLDQHSALLRAEALIASAEADYVQKVMRRDRIVSLRSQLAVGNRNNIGKLERLGWPPSSTREVATTRLGEIQLEIGRLQLQRSRRVRWLVRLANLNGRTSSEATRRRDSASRLHDASTRRLDDAVGAEQRAAESFASSATQLFSEAVIVTPDRIDAAIAIAAEAEEKAQAEYDAASRALTEQELRLAPLQQAEAGLRARITEATAERAAAEKALGALPQQWRTLGWVDADMAPDRIEAAAANLNRLRQTATACEASLKRLRDGREAWARQIAHRSAFERLFAKVDLAPNSTREQVRAVVSDELARIEAELRATSASKEIAAKASAAIADAVNKFNAAYIKPLDELTKRINRTILCDPRIGIDLRVGKRDIKQSAALDGQLSGSAKVDAALIHSEGQMAALAVSMLCAASLTYPWSRWRALVFDDPLQHNDAIHASAFADFVGNLVKAKDYQVLISTHDLGQAEFLHRKFEARGLSYAFLNLLGQGEAGVEWEFVPARGTGLLSASSSA